MNKRILIPTDFSNNALNASRYAIDLYAKLNCEFYFLNIFRLDYYTTRNLNLPEPGSTEYETAKAESEDNFIKLFDLLGLNNANSRHTYHKLSSFNFLSEAVKQTIAENDIDLVVMGTKGATSNRGVIFGSNTINAMEKIRECPVLAVPQEVRFSTPKEIVFPTDYKSTFKRKELNYLIELARMHDTSIQILYVAKKPELDDQQKSNKKLLDDILGAIDHNFHTLSEKDVSEGITSFIESRNSDLLAFINRKHFFFGSVFSQPLIKEIGYDAKVPILALH